MQQIYLDVLVIGAGQAGLAAAYYLKRSRASFAVLGKERRIGDMWRNRYDSLVLFTPRSYSSLPQMAMEGDPNGYAGKDEAADYLENYARRFEIPVRLDCEVFSLERTDQGFKAVTSQGAYYAKKAIVATGPFQQPLIPRMADGLSEQVFQTHTSHYLNPSQLKEGPVLIVGAGNSGAQIAVELANEKERDVYLSVGHNMKFLPLRAMGKSIFWWFDRMGMLRANVHSKAGQLLSKTSDPIFGLELRQLIRRKKIRLKPRTEHIANDTVSFADGSRMSFRNVIWATGFRSDYGWIGIPGVLGDDGKPIHERGVSPVRGLYFLGLPWQYRRGSALLGGVGADAEFVVHRLLEWKTSPEF